MAIVIQGGHILDPGRFNAVGDLVIDQGKILAIGQRVNIPADWWFLDS
jgi:dihydroorotase